ncbi:MAG: hypothetical protein MZU97_27215 [Bacillus subtilis]|nr:hypothetical protein [Bacillus subtilis]
MDQGHHRGGRHGGPLGEGGAGIRAGQAGGAGPPRLQCLSPGWSEDRCRAPERLARETVWSTSWQGLGATTAAPWDKKQDLKSLRPYVLGGGL